MSAIFDEGKHRLGGCIAERMTLANLERTKGNASMHDYLHEFDPAKDNAYICGPVGCGKTHAATAMAIAHEGEVYGLSVILRTIRRGMKQKELDEGDIIGLFCGRKVSTFNSYAAPIKMLVIDDLGTEKMTEFAESTLFEIVNSRIMNDVNGLIITSNLPLSAMAERLGSERIPSRIAAMCRVFNLEGERDRRIDIAVKRRGK